MLFSGLQVMSVLYIVHEANLFQFVELDIISSLMAKRFSLIYKRQMVAAGRIP